MSLQNGLRVAFVKDIGGDRRFADYVLASLVWEDIELGNSRQRDQMYCYRAGEAYSDTRSIYIVVP